MRTKEMVRVAQKLNELDDALGAAQRVGNVSEQVALLRERGRVWRGYAVLLEQSGRDSVGATLAALRDETNALQLEGGRFPE
jgi:hypothetical protein